MLKKSFSTQVYHRMVLEIILNSLRQIVIVMKDYSRRRRTVYMVLLITIVFKPFIVLLLKIFFQQETFPFDVRHTLFLS